MSQMAFPTRSRRFSRTAAERERIEHWLTGHLADSSARVQRGRVTSIDRPAALAPELASFDFAGAAAARGSAGLDARAPGARASCRCPTRVISVCSIRDPISRRSAPTASPACSTPSSRSRLVALSGRAREARGARARAAGRLLPRRCRGHRALLQPAGRLRTGTSLDLRRAHGGTPGLRAGRRARILRPRECSTRPATATSQGSRSLIRRGNGRSGLRLVDATAADVWPPRPWSAPSPR